MVRQPHPAHARVDVELARRAAAGPGGGQGHTARGLRCRQTQCDPAPDQYLALRFVKKGQQQNRLADPRIA